MSPHWANPWILTYTQAIVIGIVIRGSELQRDHCEKAHRRDVVRALGRPQPIERAGKPVRYSYTHPPLFEGRVVRLACKENPAPTRVDDAELSTHAILYPWGDIHSHSPEFKPENGVRKRNH
jgi:hypothetical protein